MNDFKTDLNFSHEAEDLLIWKEIYNKAFPGNQSITNQRNNGELQAHGIDRTIVLNSGKAIYIDEKIRRKAYNDILLEFESNNVTHSKGWAEKPLFCDYIAYAILPLNICYLLPVPQLQKVWAENKDKWIDSYGIVPAENKTYYTLNCPVPIDVLFKTIGQALRINYNVR